MTSLYPFREGGSPATLTRARQLLTPDALALLVATRAPVCLVEVGCGAREAYLRGHIPGALYIDTDQLEAGPYWNKVADRDLLACLLSAGISHDSCVLLYARQTLPAARLAHLLLYAGVRDVRLLDGGFAAWLAAGLPLERGCAPMPAAALAFGAPFPGRPDYLIDTAAARRALAGGDTTLASIRTWREFTGQTSGYSYIAARGDIAGARWGHAGSGDDVNSMSAFQDGEGCMLPARAIAAVWREAGIVPWRRTVFYCGTGWRASLAFYYAWLMGWDNISLYDGGWCEWSADPANPVVCRSDVVRARA